MRASYAAYLARKIGAFCATRPARLQWPGGVVSFTFDDFPKTALDSGGAILRQYKARGTYYASLGLAGTTRNLGPMFEIDDLRAASQDGHEIACHTYNHLDLVGAEMSRIVGEVVENAAALSASMPDMRMTTFAYPYGAVSIAAKRALAYRFACCRGTAAGINHGRVDLADLRGTEVYDSKYDRTGLCGLIERNREVGGWLIFYTHDVEERPSPFGCKPAQLEELVAHAVERSAVLPVRDVAVRLGFSQA